MKSNKKTYYTPIVEQYTLMRAGCLCISDPTPDIYYSPDQGTGESGQTIGL